MKRWPVSVRIAALATAVVAVASATLSWDALQWGAAQLGVDPRLTWLYPVAIDGTIVVGTVAALALRRDRWRVRGYVWTLLGAAIGASVVGNAAHAAGDTALHRVGAAVPAAALAASLHLLVILVRATTADAELDTDRDTIGTSARPNLGADMSGSVSASRSRTRPPREVVRRLVARHGADVTPAMVQARTGVSRRHAARLLREERRPVVVPEEVAR